MNLRKTPIALALAAASGAMPFAVEAAPTGVAFTAPAAGGTMTGTYNQGTGCQVTGSGISRVVFYMDSTALNTELTSPWQCNVDTRRFSNGTHTLRAVAYAPDGTSTTVTRSVTVQNGTTTTPTPAPAPTTSTGSPSVTFKAPLSGATLSGTMSQSAACEAIVASSSSIRSVQFFLDSTALNTEGTAPWNCNLDTTRFSNGTHTLRAVATDSSGRTGSGQIAVNIQNGTASAPAPTPAPAPTTGAPAVAFKAPLAGATVSGSMSQTAACEITATPASGSTVRSVQFFLDSTALNTEGSAPWNCNLDSTRFSNGSHTLRAVAPDSSGRTGSGQIAINIQNGTTSTPTSPTPTSPTTSTPTPTPTAPTSSLPSTNTKAVATFESIGLYWKPGTNPGAAGCMVRYKKTSDSAWKEGLAMWYDSRNAECRGSLVHLAPNTNYEVQMGHGGTFRAGLVAKTWSEQFPIAKTVTVPSGSATLNITEGGTPNGYVLYTGPATLDAKNATNYNVRVTAPYVIIRGLTLKGAKVDAISIAPGAHDVVIEKNDISGWGRQRTTPNGSWAADQDAGIRAICNSSWRTERIVIQNNKIHSPRYNSNTWDLDHPAGAQAIVLYECGPNHVFRYNDIYSANGNYFNDAIGGGENYSSFGFPNADTDIYGNKISHAYDDAIEAEGANRNVRIWGNYMDQTAIGIATTATHTGPVYIWRNVQDRSRMFYNKPLDSDDRPPFAKSGQNSGYGGGRRYFFHNTTLQRTQSGASKTLGVGTGVKGNTGQPLTNSVSRNNVWHLWTSGATAVWDMGGTGNDFDYDMMTGGVNMSGTQYTHRIISAPTYKSGHGAASGAGGNYQLLPGSRGYNEGVRIPNFNDDFTGTAPDVGAHEDGKPAMRFGVR